MHMLCIVVVDIQAMIEVLPMWMGQLEWWETVGKYVWESSAMAVGVRSPSYLLFVLRGEVLIVVIVIVIIAGIVIITIIITRPRPEKTSIVLSYKLSDGLTQGDQLADTTPTYPCLPDLSRDAGGVRQPPVRLQITASLTQSERSVSEAYPCFCLVQDRHCG